jgi:hypothetical protein
LRHLGIGRDFRLRPETRQSGERLIEDQDLLIARRGRDIFREQVHSLPPAAMPRHGIMAEQFAAPFCRVSSVVKIRLPAKPANLFHPLAEPPYDFFPID